MLLTRHYKENIIRNMKATDACDATADESEKHFPGNSRKWTILERWQETWQNSVLCISESGTSQW